MPSCETVLPLIHSYIESIYTAISIFVVTFVGEHDHRPFEFENLLLDFDYHHIASIQSFVSESIAALDTIRANGVFSDSFVRIFDHLVGCLEFIKIDLVYVMRHYCQPSCEHHIAIPLASTQMEAPFDTELLMSRLDRLSLNSTDMVRDVPDNPNVYRHFVSIDDNAVEYRVTNSTINSQVNDRPPAYDYPPNFEIATSETLFPTTIIRYSLEVFEVLWDLLLNSPSVPEVREYDMLDFVAVQSLRDDIIALFPEAPSFADFKDTLRKVENLFDRVKWYGKPRLEEYFRRHNPNILHTRYGHVSCPACCSGMLHCYKYAPYEHSCPVPEKCLRYQMSRFFEPNTLIPYSTLWHLLTQRKNYSMQYIFEFYAKRTEFAQFEHFLANVEKSMQHAGYRSTEMPHVQGTQFDLVFSPRPMHCLVPAEYHEIYTKFFKNLITGTEALSFAQFLSIALSGSLRQARLYHSCPPYIKKMLWEGALSWDMVEPYSRNVESLLSRLTLDSIFAAYRSGVSWNLLSEFDKIYDLYKKLKSEWRGPSDNAGMYFIGQLPN